MIQQRLTLALLMVGCVLLLTDDSRGAQITVGKGGIISIQQAVDLALGNTETSDTILVPKGTYIKSVLVDFTAGTDAQEKLKIKRTGKGQVLIRAQSLKPAIRIKDSANVYLENLTLDSDLAANVPALLVDGESANVEAVNVNGVAGGDIGVWVLGVNALGVRLSGCDFSGMNYIGFLLDGFGHELNNCAADDCGWNGIVLTGLALDCMISKCSAKASGGFDPLSTHLGYVTLHGNGHLVTKTTISGSGKDGLWVEGSGHRIEKCVSKNNAEAGFNLDAARVLVKKCEATGNEYGLLGGGLGATITGGEYSMNTADGLHVTEGGTNIDSLTADKNGNHGINVGMVIGTKIRDCEMNKNTGEAIQVDGQLTWVEGNLARNGDGFVDAGTKNSGRNNTVKGGGINDF